MDTTDKDILISVYSICYNQERFVAQAMESVIQQQCTYRVEMVISDDCSTDGTAAVIREYAAKYPDIIKPLYQKKNLGYMANCIVTMMACTGKYIAILEGDDYFTDPLKLQKQVDFLEANPDFSLCFSDVVIKDEMGLNLPANKYFPEVTKDVFTTEDFIMMQMNVVPTPTMLFRNLLPRPLPEFYRNALSGDICILILMGDKGKAKRMPEAMAAYRNHSGGVTKTQSNLDKGDAALFTLFMELNAYLEYRHDAVFRKWFLNMTRKNLIYRSKNLKGMARVKQYLKHFPLYLKYSDKLDYKEIVYYHMLLFFPKMLKKVASK